MNQIDLLIIIGLVLSIVRGTSSGFTRQLFSTAGFFGGLLLAVLIDPKIVQLVHGSTARSFATLIFNLSLAFICSGVAEAYAIRLKYRFTHRYFERFDSTFGAILAGFTFLITVWLAASIVVKLPYPDLQDMVRKSAIVGRLDRSLPQAPTVVAKLSTLIEPNGFPQVFNGAEPTPGNATLPAASVLSPAVNADAASIVKIQGFGCGGIVDGSGFIVAKGIVATNAHVVAGISRPKVIDQAGAHSATPIWFDSKLDLAFLRVNGLSGKALSLQPSKVTADTPAAAVGYPGGGPFNAQPAVVTDNITAVGRSIYDTGVTMRDVYVIKATVRPGNSGGPLITTDGKVIGVIFAESTQYNNVGYALTANQVVAELNQVKNSNQVVSTGRCAE